MTQKSKTAMIAGSFNPFTVGHKSIVDRTLNIADKVVVAVGRNLTKEANGEAEARAEAIRKIYADNAAVRVICYDGLTIEAARREGVDFMVRGVRSVADFEYERSLADANLDAGGIETLLMPALPKYSFISSSMVRELKAFGADVSKYLP